MSDLSDDEFTCLSIAAEGQSMMPIGRWEKPVERLVELGLLRRENKFNNYITQAGRDAIKGHEQKQTDDFLRAANNVRQNRHRALQYIEQAATALAEAAKLGQQTTGGPIDYHVEQAAASILSEARRLLQ